MSNRLKQRIVHAATSLTIKGGSNVAGTIFTTRGATGAITFTLPRPQRPLLGDWYEFQNVVDQTMTVAGAAAGDIITKNDLAANSVAASTVGEKIGARLRATCIEISSGTYKWVVSGVSVGHTYTVAT